MTIFPFQSFFTNRQVSIWQQQTEQPVPKLSDSLVIKRVKNDSSVETLNKEELAKEPASIKINGIKYNKKKGKALADRVLAGIPAHNDYPLCAKYVKEAIRDVGLGPYINGNGEYCKYILRANPNFKETKLKGEDLKKLPAGTVIVYDAYSKCIDAQGEENQFGKDGHVLVCLGDKRGCSDRIEETIPISDNAYIFIPV